MKKDMEVKGASSDEKPKAHKYAVLHKFLAEPHCPVSVVKAGTEAASNCSSRPVVSLITETGGIMGAELCRAGDELGIAMKILTRLERLPKLAS